MELQALIDELKLNLPEAASIALDQLDESPTLPSGIQPLQLGGNVNKMSHQVLTQ